ncbi:TetR/AcrR family transcriptional regulator [Rhodococcus rhodnii]|uniref:TetR/AcrR family transcriptional regulator n=1 Tax=Rhodococcus rhodnii TaxID=38312 RepID=A0A6P2CKI8_9NOCA|nr:TetR/AcrR family transcriptional regulator [Rhodococcus rhodnii]TXG92321.1 TetR/AcrR family transcriptional regulator [Rhodococcus rhodnii]
MTSSVQPDPAGRVPRPPRDEVRRRLLDASADEFAARGFRGARLTEVAARAGFTKGAVYSNFESKHVLFGELVARRSLDLAEHVLAEIAGMRPRAAAQRAGHLVATAVTGDDGWPLLVVEFAVLAARDEAVAAEYRRQRRDIRSRLVDLVADRAREWGVGDDIDAAATVLSLTALVSGLVVEHATDPERIDRDAVAASVTEFVTGAVAGAASREKR